ncbi:hypothetical protein GCM10020358_70500 [Amorphoplanes nipponensis]|uniref:NACHT domain-containing protein n=2 Tax=Actinoplanes nipponensis TaxID=135950 RepID=A0A919JD81_9ACTN|nr:hypothetical protein Ani05nite_03010 [Actinoplanes nipponensis]
MKVAVAALSAAVATAGAIAVNIATSSKAVAWNDPVWLLVVLTTAASGYLTYRLNASDYPGSRVSTAAAGAGLSRMVAAQWRREEEFQHIEHPYPLPLSWRVAPEEIMDNWANIRLAGPGESVAPIPLANSLPHILDVFDSIPSGRLVILGAGGSGKSVLARRLGLDMVSARRAEGRVPVIFHLCTWDPRLVSYQVWMAQQLVREQPSLLAPTATGSTVATALIEEGRILPILDGFDEVAEGLRRDVLRLLGEASGPLVLTSRSAEYAAHARRIPLAKSAVIELSPLEFPTVADYLRRSGRQRQAARADDETGWAAVFAALATKPYAGRVVTLKKAFSTPLIVSLARSVYEDPEASDPTELLDRRRFASHIQIESSLLHGFLPAVYRTTAARGPRAPWNGGDSGMAEKYLRTIAVDLDRRGDWEISWWTMPDMLSRPMRALILGGLGGIGVIAAIMLVGWDDFGTTFSVAVACAVSVTASACFGFGSFRVRPVTVRMVPRADWRTLTVLLGVSGLIWTAIWMISPADRGFNAGIIHAAVAKLVRASGTGVSEALHQVIDGIPRYFTYLGTVGTAVGLAGWLVGHVSRTRPLLRALLFVVAGTSAVAGSTIVVGLVLLVDEGGAHAAWRSGAGVFAMVIASALAAFVAARAVSRRWKSSRGRDYFVERALASFGYGMLVSLVVAVVFGLLGVAARHAQVVAPAPDFDGGLTAEQRAYAELPTALQYLYQVSSAVLGGIDLGLPLAFAVSLGAGIALSLVGAFTAPMDVTAVPNAAYLFRQDRTSSVVLLVAGGVFAGVLSIEFNAAASRFLVGFVITAVFVMATTAWGRWTIFARFWMTLTGALPWRALDFLEDAHERGVLRQSGGGYQFRHSAIQRHLADQRRTAPTHRC